MSITQKIPFRTLLLLLGVIIAVIVVFLLFGERVEDWAAAAMERSAAHPVKAALLVIGLLVIDVLVPIPSSIVCTAAGMLLGIWGGTLAAWIGLNGTVLASYLIGRFAATPALHVIGKQEFLLLQRFHQRHGLWLLLALRPVPILSEASVLFSGISRQPILPVLAITALGNLVVASAYVLVGVWGRETGAFLPAFGISIALSAIVMGIARYRTRAHTPTETEE